MGATLNTNHTKDMTITNHRLKDTSLQVNSTIYFY